MIRNLECNINTPGTSSLSRVVRGGWDSCSVKFSGEKKFPAVESSTCPLNSQQLFRKLPKNKNKNIGVVGRIAVIIRIACS